MNKLSKMEIPEGLKKIVEYTKECNRFKDFLIYCFADIDNLGRCVALTIWGEYFKKLKEIAVPDKKKLKENVYLGITSDIFKFDRNIEEVILPEYLESHPSMKDKIDLIYGKKWSKLYVYLAIKSKSEFGLWGKESMKFLGDFYEKVKEE